MLLTDRADLHERMLALRYNGIVNREECIEPSPNGRLHTLQAAILLERLKRVDDIIARRREIASRYHELLAEVVCVPTA